MMEVCNAMIKKEVEEGLWIEKFGTGPRQVHQSKDTIVYVHRRKSLQYYH
jgi:hypothetical protein